MNYFQLVLLCLVTLASGCETLTRIVPPRTLLIDVQTDERCATVSVKPTVVSCPPEEHSAATACQQASNSGGARFVKWRSEAGEEFTLEFPSGTPFVKTRGKCAISVPGSEFRCRVRKSSLRAEYQYHVKFSENCYQDQKLYLIK